MLWPIEPEPVLYEDLHWMEMAYSQYPWHEWSVRDVSSDIEMKAFKNLNYKEKEGSAKTRQYH